MAILKSGRQAMIELFQKRVAAELAGDLDTTMNPMSQDPHLHNTPAMLEGLGRDGVYAFYRNHLPGKFFPPLGNPVEMAVVVLAGGEDDAAP
jgi:carboxymethylenebutenolidase